MWNTAALYGEGVPDEAFDDEYLASLYDRLNPDRGDEAFYLHLMFSAEHVLDVGCGTGALLCKARKEGHKGRLVGLDPAPGMLAQARRYPAVEWVAGYLPAAGFAGEFDLAYMTGHAFQALLSDDDIRELLAAVHRALRPSGRFAFETRNPLVRAWERWTPDDVTEVRDDAGTPVRVWHEVQDVVDEYVTFTETFAGPGGEPSRVSRSTLRFLRAEELDHRLAEAGFAIDERYGSWDRSLFTPTSPEIITVASTG
jgi:SAM-dependent methyltransferase